MLSGTEISWLGKYFTLHRVIHSYVQNITHSFMGTIASRNVNHSWVVPTASVLKAIRNMRRSWAEMGLVHNWNEAHQVMVTVPGPHSSGGRNPEPPAPPRHKCPRAVCILMEGLWAVQPLSTKWLGGPSSGLICSAICKTWFLLFLITSSHTDHPVEKTWPKL